MPVEEHFPRRSNPMKSENFAAETLLIVSGMTCGKCVKAVTDAAMKIDGVAQGGKTAGRG